MTKSGADFPKKWLCVTLLAYAAMQVYCLHQLSINYDEGLFAAYGTTVLKRQKEKAVLLYESKLPITALNMLPRAVEQLFNPSLNRGWPESKIDIVHGRYISLFVSILLGLLIFHWSKQLYNGKTAFYILLMYLLCPNFLAHGIFVSSDIFACFFMTAAIYCLWLFFEKQRFRYFLLLCLSTGFAEISKFSMFHLLLLLPFLFAVQHYYRKKRNKGYSIGTKKALGYLALFFFLNWLIICAAHFFYQVFVPLNNYTFISPGFKSLQQQLSRVFPALPVPLPAPYIQSMDAVMYFDHLGGGVTGSLNGAPYILGDHSVTGFWYYYLVAIFFKLPLPVLFLWIGSIVFLFARFSRKLFFENEFFLLLPILYFLVYMNVFYATQVGIRHLLIIFPLFFVLSGKLINFFQEMQKQWLLPVLLLLQAVSVLRYFPHFLPYTNEFILNKKLAYRKLADTNLCYGEGEPFLKSYLAKHPEAVYMPSQPVAGTVVLEVNDLLNLNMPTAHHFDWAIPLTPVDHIHSQYLVFAISRQAADSLQKAQRLK